MPNYQQGRIYKIESSDSLPYIGSTTQPLSSRMSGHRKEYKIFETTGKGNTTSVLILSKIDCKITLLENYPCNSKEELLSRERHWIGITECVNKVKKPFITEEEKKEYQTQYRIDNKEQMKEYQTQYRIDNKEYHSQYRIDNKEAITEYKKQYRIDKKEAITEYQKQYYIKQKEKL